MQLDATAIALLINLFYLHIIGYTVRSCHSVVVPPELRIDGVCCVGLSSSATLLIHNPFFRWQCIRLNVDQFSIDGKAEDQHVSPFVVRSKVTIDPNSTESVKVC